MRNLVWTFWVAIILAVIATFISSAFLVRQWTSFQTYGQIEDLSQYSLQALTNEIQNTIYRKNELERVLLNTPINRFGEVYLVNSSGEDALDRNLPEEILDNIEKQSFNIQQLFTKIIKTDNGELYSLIVRPHSPTPIWNFFKRFGLYPILIALLVVSGIISWWLAIMFARPIQHIAKASSYQGEENILPRINNKILNRHDEIGKLARQLQKSGKKIQELLKKQKDFLRDVSHEVRSPLARLQLAAETLELDIKDKKAINQIKEEVMIIDQLVQDLLYLSHFDRPSFSHEISDISISDLINKCIKRSNIIACQKNLSIHLEGLDQHDINIRAIELLIDRALDNVINNAIRYSPEGSKITINYKDDSEFCYLEICDQGEGVHDDNLEKIFEPFFRTDSSRNRQTGGFGLGLALVKRIMELHQGSVTAVNQLEGFMVRMTIPVEMKL